MLVEKQSVMSPQAQCPVYESPDLPLGSLRGVGQYL
jgi:hypothetical protein